MPVWKNRDSNTFFPTLHQSILKATVIFCASLSSLENLFKFYIIIYLFSSIYGVNFVLRDIFSYMFFQLNVDFHLLWRIFSDMCFAPGCLRLKGAG